MCSQVSHFPSTGSEGLRLHVLKEVMEQAMERHPGSLEEDIPQTHSKVSASECLTNLDEGRGVSKKFGL